MCNLCQVEGILIKEFSSVVHAPRAPLCMYKLLIC